MPSLKLYDGTQYHDLSDAKRLGGKLPGEYAEAGHNHDTTYAPIAHNHDTLYAPIVHNHDTVYSKLDHTHTEYALVSHNHDDTYAPLTHTHAIADVIDLGTVLALKPEIDDLTASTSAVYSSSRVDELIADVSARTPTSHTHEISEVTGLSDALALKSDSTHNHDTSYAALDHTHSDYLQLSGGTLSGLVVLGDGASVKLNEYIYLEKSATNTGGVEISTPNTKVAIGETAQGEFSITGIDTHVTVAGGGTNGVTIKSPFYVDEVLQPRVHVQELEPTAPKTNDLWFW